MIKTMKIPAVLLSILALTTCLYSQVGYAETTTNDQTTFDERVKDKLLDKYNIYSWKDLGYSSMFEYYDDLLVKQSEAEGIADEAINLYSQVITDEQSELLRNYEKKLTTAVTIQQYNEYLEMFDEVIAECEGRMPKTTRSSSYSGGSSYYSNGGGLTRSGGVNWFNGRRETWYSQRVLSGGGLNIPGRHVATDGTIRDADGYIVVAASDIPKGTVVDTSLGTGKVYDTGCAAGTTDIYTDW